MYAVIASGGKQYRVSEGQVLKLETLPTEVGGTVEFDKVMLIADGDNVNIGAPLIAGATVTAEVIEHGRAEKIRIIKFRRRKHHMKHMGHRQNYTQVKITSIGAQKGSAKKKAATAPTASEE
ncbi:MAG: 50S ribosomal protein L21 [Pseudomonadota bacterium]|nr:50S ribosomal protein L21 [Pseudomonadota bacterium]